MGEERGNMDENGGVTRPRRFWGLRPWSRHSGILMVAGVLYFLIGLQYVVVPDNPVRNNSLVVLLQVFPLQVWGGVFMASGVGAFISSRWPPISETWGYMVLTGLSTAWSATYLLGFLLFAAPASNISGALFWALPAFLWWAISGLLNPDKTGVIRHGID